MQIKQNPGERRAGQRQAKAERFAFQAKQLRNKTIADFPKQLAELEEKLKKEESSPYKDAAYIERIKKAILLKQQQIARYSGSAKE